MSSSPLDTRGNLPAAGPASARASVLLWLAVACNAGASEQSAYLGLSLEEALERLRSAGLALVYSTDLVRPGMRVQQEPVASDSRGALIEMLGPHGLSVVDGPAGTLLLVRAAPAVVGTRQHGDRPTPLDEIVVSASHYLLGVKPTQSPAVFSAADLELLPDLGEDPVRAVARLPGVASQDFSSRAHLRGGLPDETLVRFDGVRLYDPYHFKDFLGIFSSIDPGLVSDINVYTGGFPVSFGDRTSGVIDIRPHPPSEDFGGQVSLSLLNAGTALGGSFDDGSGDWLVSARRGNLDLFFGLASTSLGKPSYYDAYGHVGRAVGRSARVSANVLVFDDVVRAFDSDREEDARAAYRDAYYWLRLDVGDTLGRGARMLAAHTQLSSERRGTADLPGVGRGSLEDQRFFTFNSLQADAWWRPTPRSVLQAGAEWRALHGSYRYQDEAEFDLLFLTPGAIDEPSRVRTAVLRPEGQQYGAYLNWRVEPAATLTADIGLRWDRETLSGDSNGEVSPRAVLLWKPREDTRLRFSWGRFVQAQGINELAVSDGETRFLPPQRATHLVASLERRLAPGLELRIEAYRKDYDRLLPRYENLLNPLVVLPELKPDRIRIAPQSAQAKGVELSLHYNREPFSGWLSYSWSQVEDYIDASTVRRSWDQRHDVSSGLSYRTGGWQFAVAAVWHSGWPATEVELATSEPLPLIEAGSRNAIRLSDYARIDARLARRFELNAGGDLTFFLEAVNVLKRGNSCCIEYDLETVDGDISFDAGPRTSLPLIPSIGFIWRF